MMSNRHGWGKGRILGREIHKLKEILFHGPPDYAAVPTSLPTLGPGADAEEHIMETALGGPHLAGRIFMRDGGEMVLNASRLQETKT